MPTPRRWREHLPAILILGSPAVAAGMAHCVALTGLFLLPDVDVVTIGAAVILRLNVFLAPVGAAAGALRVGGTVSTRVAVLIASVVFAAAAYVGSIVLATEFIPGFVERYDGRQSMRLGP